MDDGKIKDLAERHLVSLDTYDGLVLRRKLKDADDSLYTRLLGVKTVDLKNVTLLSVFLGHLGVDRFYMGDIIFGVIKLLLALSLIITSAIGSVAWIPLAIILPILWISDIFLSRYMTMRRNYRRIRDVLNEYGID